jgi:hypothetical protein
MISANDVWAVGSWGQNGGQGLIEHWDGRNWSVGAVLPQGTLLIGVAAQSSNDIWAVGQNLTQTLVEHWNGRQWVAVPSPNLGSTYNTLHAVSIISHNDAWAVGYSLSFDTGNAYILMHWNGTTWSLVNGPPANSSYLFSVKAFATDDVWAVGYKDYDSTHGTSSTFTLHWDGTTWTEIATPNAATGLNNLFGLDGNAPNDVWAVGYSSLGGLAMHWDGTAWTVVPTPVDEGLFFAVRAFSARNVWAVGSLGNQPGSARWDGTQWRVIPTPAVNNSGFLSAISGRNRSIWTVGQQDWPDPTDLIFTWTRSGD